MATPISLGEVLKMSVRMYAVAIYMDYGLTREQAEARWDAAVAERQRLNAIGPVHGPVYECDECECPCHPPRNWELQ